MLQGEDEEREPELKFHFSHQSLQNPSQKIGIKSLEKPKVASIRAKEEPKEEAWWPDSHFQWYNSRYVHWLLRLDEF